MPQNKDPGTGGTEADGTKSSIYCSYCYQDGVFTWQGDDVKAYQKYVVNQMVKDGWMRPIAWLFTRRIPKLSRWSA
ncbi:MAG: zinc ribbon domain-containing protein [Pikeienuella sp.]